MTSRSNQKTKNKRKAICFSRSRKKLGNFDINGQGRGGECGKGGKEAREDCTGRDQTTEVLYMPGQKVGVSLQPLGRPSLR